MLLKQIWRPFICAASALASSHNCKAVSFRAATVVNLPNPNSYGDDITGMASGDFNGDGRPDLVVTNGPAGVITILLYNRERNFEPFATYPAGSFPGAVAVGDFNHDGNLDIVVASQNSADFSILLGLGNGKFEPSITYRFLNQLLLWPLLTSTKTATWISRLATLFTSARAIALLDHRLLSRRATG